MTTISQHYVARAARLEIITRESLCNALTRTVREKMAGFEIVFWRIVSRHCYIFGPNYVSGLLLSFSPSVKLNDQRGGR